MNYLDMNISQMQELFDNYKAPKFRAKQFYQALHKGKSIEDITNLPKELRAKLIEDNTLGGASIIKELVSRIDGTEKYLFALEDNNVVEGVLMKHSYGNTLCISSQVGCAMGCKFCASTKNGKIRNLNAGEMLGQVLAVEKKYNKDIEKNHSRFLRNIVIMGIGEPLDNYDNVIKFLKLINSEDGLNFSLRNISLSTCGIVEKIKTLTVDAPGVTLSISLHAPNDKKRQEIMPIARKVSVNRLVSSAKEYIKQTGRRVIFEYALVEGFNDSDFDAKELSQLLRFMQCIVNIIPVNKIKEGKYLPPDKQKVKEFVEKLADLGIDATIRREMGADINGACGQLRNSTIEESYS